MTATSVFASLGSRERVGSSSYKVRKSTLGSSYIAERFDRDPIILEGHSGCVNSILFTDCGSQIITGADDRSIRFWDLEGEMVNHMPTIHTNNVFFAKDLPATGCNDIVSCAADGRVVLSNVVQSEHRQIFRHKGRAHRIALVPLCPTQFYSGGEDGVCCLFDIRTLNKPTGQDENMDSSHEDIQSCLALKTKFTSPNYRSSSIYCLSVNQCRPHEIAMGGTSPSISIYDTRKFQFPMAHLCPTHLMDTENTVTGLRYDFSGENIIGSYNDDDIYRMSVADHAAPHRLDESLRKKPIASPGSSKEEASFTPWNGDGNAHPRSPSPSEDSSDLDDGYLTRYAGHRNNDTVKQVSFLGSQSEMVVSGSDCGNIFIWDTDTGRLINMFTGDAKGAVNCLTGHPYLPYLATSGLDTTAKLWLPTGIQRPIADKESELYKEVNETLEQNASRRSRGETARSDEGEGGFPSADILSWMEAQLNEGGIGDDVSRARMMMMLMSRTLMGHVQDDEDSDNYDSEEEQAQLDYDYDNDNSEDESEDESPDDDEDEDEDDDDDDDSHVDESGMDYPNKMLLTAMGR